MYVPLDAAAGAVGGSALGERGEETGGVRVLLIEFRGNLGPDRFDAGQPQLAEKQFDGCDGGVDHPR
jgi:hypothetical protein